MLTQPKILVWGAYKFKKMPKQGSGMLQTFLRSPIKTKIKGKETSNMAQNDCHVVF